MTNPVTPDGEEVYTLSLREFRNMVVKASQTAIGREHEKKMPVFVLDYREGKEFFSTIKDVYLITPSEVFPYGCIGLITDEFEPGDGWNEIKDEQKDD